MATPFLKWAGGKAKLADRIIDLFGDLSAYGSYYEPFLGGGAVFFNLFGRDEAAHLIAHLSDINEELINCYRVLRDTPNRLINHLRDPRYVYEESAFYAIRASEPHNPVMRAARMIYLNKTCFNGVYRVNSKGIFNVPFGKHKNPTICNEPVLRAASDALFKANISPATFGSYGLGREKCIFYFDPPYVPLSATADFTAYAKEPFGPDEQKALMLHARALARKGHKVVLSNSDTPLVRELYSEKDFVLHPISASRSVSCTGDRSDAKEFLIVGRTT